MVENPDIIRLADSHLPPRVRQVAVQLLVSTETELGGRIGLMLEHLQTQLFKQAERAHSSTEQADLLKAVQTIKTRKDAFRQTFFQLLEGQLSQLRNPVSAQAGAAGHDALPSSQWTVHAPVPETEIAEIQLRDLASPLERTSKLALYLLGQRFGVLAGAPAFSPNQLCLGPGPLIKLAGHAAHHAFDDRVPQSTLQSHFAQQVLGNYLGFVERINATLDDLGVLSGLAYVPVRPSKASLVGTSAHTPANQTQPVQAHPATADDAAKAKLLESGALTALATSDGHHWLDQPSNVLPINMAQAPDFRYLQQLLRAHRVAGTRPSRANAAPDAQIPESEVDHILQDIQSASSAKPETTRSIHGLHESMLAHARDGHGPDANLANEDLDTFEILSLLYQEITREVRAGSSVHALLERLQLPLLRLALKDRGFFEQPSHPGRQLLNTIAETDASAYGNHAIDPYFEAAMHKAVEQMEGDDEASPEMLAKVNDELQAQLSQQVKRSQSNEKRWIDAARGRERMSLAKQTATQALNALLDTHKPPRATSVLLRRAWLDAMTLTVLRHGDASSTWQQQLETTRSILETVKHPEPLQSPKLAREIETAMRRVGYHDGEALALSQHLSRSAVTPKLDDEPSASELSILIKHHARLGEDEGGNNAQPEAAHVTPRTTEEEACYQHLRTLPFGCWIDFIQNQQGMFERRRLSWYSTLTGRALFVNRRGQRVAEMDLDTLARLMAQGQLRVVEQEQLRLIDRAWRSTLELLRGAPYEQASPKVARK